MSLQLMKLRIKQSGLTLREETICDARRLLEWDNENDPSYCPSLFFWIPGIKPHKAKQIHARLYDRKYSPSNGNTMLFLSKYDEKIDIGDLLFNELDTTYWLCIESYDMDSIHYEGKLAQCNVMLTWQNENGDILSYPSQDISASQNNNVEFSDKVMTLGSTQRIETMTADENTIIIDSPQRFFVDKNIVSPTCYKVGQNDTTSCNYGKGLVKIIISQTEMDDSKDKLVRLDSGEQVWIADYISPPLPLSPDLSTDKNIILKQIEGNSNLKVGCTGVYKAIFRNKDLYNVNFRWNIISDFTNEIYTIVDINTIKLQIDNESYIGSYFLLQLIVDDCIVDEIKITIRGLFS